MIYGIVGVIAFTIGYYTHKVLYMKDGEYVASGNIKEL